MMKLVKQRQFSLLKNNFHLLLRDNTEHIRINTSSTLYAICLNTSHKVDFGQIEDNKEENEVIHSFIEI